MNKPLYFGINDIDIVYFDPDLSETKEHEMKHMITEKLKHSIYSIDVANEARVHLWYEKTFSKKISADNSVEDAISTWPTTATSIGVRLTNQQLEVFAPFGLDDLLI